MMYWNISVVSPPQALKPLNQNIWCIEIHQNMHSLQCRDNLNQNIWCIEMFYLHLDLFHCFQLEPKHMMYWNVKEIWFQHQQHLLNQNIWCIEITLQLHYLLILKGLNQNIWCIEIGKTIAFWTKALSLNQNIWCIEIYLQLL